MARVGLEHIWKRYGDVVAVHDVTLEAKDEEFLVLVGTVGLWQIHHPAHGGRIGRHFRWHGEHWRPSRERSFSEGS